MSTCNLSHLRSSYPGPIVYTESIVSAINIDDQPASQQTQDLLDKVVAAHSIYLSHIQHLNGLLNDLSIAHELLQNTIQKTNDTYALRQHQLTAARTDYISATIEACLVNVSLLRAHAQLALYGAKSLTQGNEHTVASATAIASRKLKAEEARMKNEERKLDQQLKEYDVLLAVVDGGPGGFRQVVIDWTKVQKETEECRKDLRRLGWTGD